MSLKAGRVGVAPDQVDEFGKVKSDALEGYTKQEADEKFETKTDVAAALAEKQPIRLSVPIELISGSALTVEDVLKKLSESFNISARCSYETSLVEKIEGSGINVFAIGNIVLVSYWFKMTETVEGGNIPVLEMPFDFSIGNYIVAEGNEGIRYGGRATSGDKYYVSVSGPLTKGKYYRTQAILFKKN